MKVRAALPTAQDNETFTTYLAGSLAAARGVATDGGQILARGNVAPNNRRIHSIIGGEIATAAGGCSRERTGRTPERGLDHPFGGRIVRKKALGIGLGMV
jgi:hypothetical protein